MFYEAYANENQKDQVSTYLRWPRGHLDRRTLSYKVQRSLSRTIESYPKLMLYDRKLYEAYAVRYILSWHFEGKCPDIYLIDTGVNCITDYIVVLEMKHSLVK